MENLKNNHNRTTRDNDNDEEDESRDSQGNRADIETEASPKKSRALIIIEIILLLFVVVLAIIFFSRKNSANPATDNTTNNSVNNSADNQYTINEAGEIVNTPISGITVNNPAANNTADSGTQGPKIIKPVEEESLRMKLPVPVQSGVADEAAIPAGAIKISGVAGGFEPKEFTVKAGEEITLALISRIDLPVVLTFYNPNMAAVAIGCGPQEARWVTFKAPTTPGEYIFKNDVIGHSTETGRMIVK
jgi:hypothetical protein